MNIPNPSPLLKSFYTITEKLEQVERDFREIRTEISALRTECSELAKDVAVLKASLENNEKVLGAAMHAVVSEIIADLRTQYAEQQIRQQSNLLLPPPKSDSES